MAQAHAKKKGAAPRKRGGGSGTPNWVWLLTGVATGAFIMFLAYLSGITPQKLQLAPAIKTTAGNDNTAPAQQAKPTFEFYDSLKNNEIIPAGTTKPSTKTTTTEMTAIAKDNNKATVPVAEKISYLLQVASLQKLSDADALKAKLTLEGLDTHVQPFTNSKGETWYRVTVGPYTDINKVTQAKATLAQHHLTPIVVQKKPGI